MISSKKISIALNKIECQRKEKKQNTILGFLQEIDGSIADMHRVGENLDKLREVFASVEVNHENNMDIFEELTSNLKCAVKEHISILSNHIKEQIAKKVNGSKSRRMSSTKASTLSKIVDEASKELAAAEENFLAAQKEFEELIKDDSVSDDRIIELENKIIELEKEWLAAGKSYETAMYTTLEDLKAEQEDWKDLGA